jgi:hypothetical protein
MGKMSDLHMEMKEAGELKLSDRFDGATFEREFDASRLKGQIKRIYDLMIDGQWRTLSEIQSRTGDPAASISAQLRNLRKPRFGAFVIDKRSKGDRSRGLFEYRMRRG